MNKDYEFTVMILYMYNIMAILFLLAPHEPIFGTFLFCRKQCTGTYIQYLYMLWHIKK